MTTGARRAAPSPETSSTAPRAQADHARRAAALPAGKAIVGALLAGAVALAGLGAAARLFDEPVATFTRDVQDQAGVHWYVGAFSTVNVIAWAAVATLGLLVAWLEPAERLRLGVFTGVVLFLLADDAFLLHEAVGPENGVPQTVFVVGYAAAGLALLTLFLREPRTGPSIALVVGGALLALALLADQVLADHLFLLEDGAKLCGTLVWLTVPLTALMRRPTRD